MPHHLFGHVSGDVRYSTGAWLREVEPLILDMLGRNKAPVLVGGTGLYFRALLQGMADIPAVPQHVVDETAARLAEGGIESLRHEAGTRSTRSPPARVSAMTRNACSAL